MLDNVLLCGDVNVNKFYSALIFLPGVLRSLRIPNNCLGAYGYIIKPKLTDKLIPGRQSNIRNKAHAAAAQVLDNAIVYRCVFGEYLVRRVWNLCEGKIEIAVLPEKKPSLYTLTIVILHLHKVKSRPDCNTPRLYRVPAEAHVAYRTKKYNPHLQEA